MKTFNKLLIAIATVGLIFTTSCLDDSMVDIEVEDFAFEGQRIKGLEEVVMRELAFIDTKVSFGEEAFEGIDQGRFDLAA